MNSRDKLLLNRKIAEARGWKFDNGFLCWIVNSADIFVDYIKDKKCPEWSSDANLALMLLAEIGSYIHEFKDGKHKIHYSRAGYIENEDFCVVACTVWLDLDYCRKNSF